MTECKPLGRLTIRMDKDDIQVYPYDDLWSMLYAAAETYCYADCSDERVEDIEWAGRKIRYCGWMPDMHYRFRFCDNDKIAFDEYFPSWDH